MDSQSGNSSYNSLQAAPKNRLSYGFVLNLAYTFSESIDDYPNGGGNAGIGADSLSAMPWYFANGRVLDRCPSGFDRRHRLVVSDVWISPRLNHAHPLIHRALGEWELSGITTLQTGDPLILTAGYDRSLTGLNNDRADLVSSQPVYQSTVCGSAINCISWLNPAAFSGPRNAGGALLANGTLGKYRQGRAQGTRVDRDRCGAVQEFHVGGTLEIAVPRRILQCHQPREPREPEHHLKLGPIRQNHGSGCAAGRTNGAQADVLRTIPCDAGCRPRLSASPSRHPH
jgi:hypothetical protein